jgi:hypothetical protein
MKNFVRFNYVYGKKDNERSDKEYIAEISTKREKIEKLKVSSRKSKLFCRNTENLERNIHISKA